MLTCGALALGNASSDAAHGGAWGFARVLRLEYPALHTQTTDVSRGASLVPPLATALTTEAEAAWRGTMQCGVPGDDVVCGVVWCAVRVCDVPRASDLPFFGSPSKFWKIFDLRKLSKIVHASISTP